MLVLISSGWSLTVVLLLLRHRTYHISLEVEAVPPQHQWNLHAILLEVALSLRIGDSLEALAIGLAHAADRLCDLLTDVVPVGQLDVLVALRLDDRVHISAPDTLES